MKRSALFVGVNRYDDPEINNLDCAESDATELYAFFKHRAGYDDVRHLLSPDSDELLDTAHEMSASLDPDDLFLFFFAGHGVEHEGRHLLLCPKARYGRLKYLQHAVPLDLLKQETTKGGLHRVLILDACRTDLLKGQRGASSGMRDVQCLRKVVSPDDSGAGSLAILCSCDEGQQAREIPQCRQGLFSASLLQVMTDALITSRQVELSDMFEKMLINQMGSIASQYGFTVGQRPWIQRSGLSPALLAGREKQDAGMPERPTATVADIRFSNVIPKATSAAVKAQTWFDEAWAEPLQLIAGGNARAAISRLQRLQMSSCSEDLAVDVLLGVALLCDRPISSMRENEIRKAESLLLPGLENPEMAGLAAYALAAIRHCFYMDHSMREPTPTFRELRKITDIRDKEDEQVWKVISGIKVCSDFKDDWLLA